MARLFALLANRPDLGARVLEAESALINHTAAPGEPLGWGAGFYQGGEVLLRRRPVDERTTLPLAAALADVRSTILLGHVRLASVGTLRTENTHPFRHRQWLFAHTGTVTEFSTLRARLVEAIPQFLQRNVRGDTDSELLFHLFLSFLHDGGHLDALETDPGAVRTALRSTVSLLERLAQEEGGGAFAGNLAVTNGEHVTVLHAGAPAAYRTYQGRHEIENLLGDASARVRIPDLDTARLHLVVSDYQGTATGFTPLAEREILTLTRAAADPSTEPLLPAGRPAAGGLPPLRRSGLPHHRPARARPPAARRRRPR
ncbi:MAG: hypothetical protein EOO75_17485, partial [Myxococcales bacterium]